MRKVIYANSRLAMIALVGMVLQLSIFKWFYPFPDFIPESYTYISTAREHLGIGILPIGYSKFLSALHALTNSDLVLPALQYFILQLSAIYFFFSTLFFFSPNKINRILLCVILLFNPLSLYLSNYVSNDSLFVALSLLWFTQLLWVIHRPARYHIVAQAALLFLCIAVDDKAYYYLIITIIGFCLSMSGYRFKLLGISTSMLVALSFALYTADMAYKVSRVAQVSLNKGWVLANDVLYARRHLVLDNSRLPTDLREVDQMVEDYFKNARSGNIDIYLSGYTTKFFIDNPQSPLHQFERRHVLEYNLNRPAMWGLPSGVCSRDSNWLIRT